MIFTSPLMLLGLGALPVLAVVYWLRSRSRRAVVSSLAFWIDPRRPRQGGRTLDRLQTPLTFFLELAAIAALATAAAGPAMLQRDLVRPLIVVLDDSYSMLAHRPGQQAVSARRRAEAALVDELRRNAYLVRFILAAAQPRLLGPAVSDPDAHGETLRLWTCHSPAADLPAALALAAQVGPATTRILVLTDRAPTLPLDSGQTQWWAFGDKLPNLAFTAATRGRSGENDRVLVEVANLADSPGTGRLTLKGGNLAAPRSSTLQLAGAGARQFFLNLPPGAPALRATLDNDALEIDNSVLLLPAQTSPLRVRVEIAESKLRDSVRRALEATGQTIAVDQRPELVIADKTGALEGDMWRVEMLGAKQATAYAGPFVIDHNHALAAGLSLASAIWAASPAAGLAGLPLVTAGNVPLVTESGDVAGRRRVQMSFVADMSNVQNTPDWPILFANLVQWRHSALSGVATPNVRLGQTVVVRLAQEAKHIEILPPDNTPRQLNVRGRQAAVPADHVGLHTVRTPGAEYQFSCNALSADESDLGACRSGRWGSWNRSPAHQDRQASLSWLFVLVALASLTAHAAVVAGESGRHAP